MQPFDFLDVGAGDPVLFLHSMAGSRTSWWPQIQSLAGRFRCVALDLPGYGRSPAIPCTTPMHELVDEVAVFVESQLGLACAHFIGLSVGGTILQQLGARHPGKVKSLTIMDSSPKFAFGGSMTPAEFVEPILRQLRSETADDSFCGSMVRAIMAPETLESAYVTATDDMRRGTRDGFALCAHLIGSHDALTVLPSIKAPTLVMVGEKDSETPPAYAQAIAARIPNAELHVVPRAGHLANIENPRNVNEHLESFLSLHS